MSVCVSTETKATLLREVLWLSVCSVWSPGYGGKVGGQEGAEGVTPKSIPLGHKSGIFCREKKGNTYATSTHFPCSLQKWSSCKTVLYLRDPQPPTIHHPPMDTVAMQYHIRRPGVSSFKPWGSNLPQFFRIQFKGVRLELLAPICKREKKRQALYFYRRCPSLL